MEHLLLQKKRNQVIFRPWKRMKLKNHAEVKWISTIKIHHPTARKQQIILQQHQFRQLEVVSLTPSSQKWAVILTATSFWISIQIESTLWLVTTFKVESVSKLQLKDSWLNTRALKFLWLVWFCSCNHRIIIYAKMMMEWL